MNKASSESSEEYSSDFEEETFEEPITVPPSHDLSVIMTFEPVSHLLNPTLNVSSGKKPKKPKIQDKPVTFHKKIKSSGYGSKAKRPKKPKFFKQEGSYPATSNPPNKIQEEHLFAKESPLHSAGIFNIKYNRDSTRLATCGGDSTAFIVKLPVAKYRGDRIPLVGHEGGISVVSWNSSCRFLLTSSLDRSMKLWDLGSSKPGECLLTIEGEFTDSKFYYLDRFLTASQGDCVSFYRFKLRDPHLKDDVKRLQSKCSFKEVFRVPHPSAQAVAKFDVHNLFHSHVMLLGGTNKTVSVWDVDKNHEILAIETPHRKFMHTLKFFKGSDYTEICSDAQNLFITAAADSTMLLYDIRNGSPVMGFEGHTNSALELGGDISPCRNYIAGGSEDRSAYIWDVRTGNVLERLKGFREATTDLAWSPLYPQLCVASNDGQVKFYRS